MKAKKKEEKKQKQQKASFVQPMSEEEMQAHAVFSAGSMLGSATAPPQDLRKASYGLAETAPGVQ